MPDLDVSKVKPGCELKTLELAIEGRKSEIDRLWSRSLVFWGLVAAAFVAYSALFDKQHANGEKVFVSCFGFIVSFAWTLQNRGSKYWQEAWETKVNLLETSALGVPLFKNKELRQRKGFWGAWQFSVSKLIIAVSDLAVLVWIGLIYVSLPESERPFSGISHFDFYIVGISIVYAFVVFIVTMSAD